MRKIGWSLSDQMTTRKEDGRDLQHLGKKRKKKVSP